MDISQLRSQVLFQGVPDEGLRLILESSHIRRVEEGGSFFFQEDPAEAIYLLEQGQVKLAQVTADGQQVILNLASPGDFFGLIGFVAGSRYPVSAEAAIDCQARYWDRPALTRMASSYPQIAMNAMSHMAARVSEFQGQIRTLATERVERRLARVLLRLARQVGKKVDEGVLIDLSVSRQDLAEMSGTTLYTVSRILSQWERQGLVNAGRERVTIRHPHGLVMIAEDAPE
jgi:CRP/FNR family transcriptional regulator, nitrogen oxide reductase regulator